MSPNPSNLHARRTREMDEGNEAFKERASEALKETKERASEVLKETIDEIRERSDDIKATVKEYVHQKPFKALGIAALSGVVLALLLRR